MTATATVRQEWADGYRALQESASDPRRHDQLVAQVEAVTDELRRRVGGAYTTAELVAAYRNAEDWARATVPDRAPAPGWPRTLSLVVAAAFHQYARGAVDYVP